MPETTLADRVALVTGGARGLGRATCIRLARAGAHVVVADIDVDGAASTVARIEAEGSSAEAVRFDVASSADRRELVERLDARYGGRFNVLVNVAGIDRPGYVDDLDEDEFLQVVAVNFTGPVLLTRLVAAVAAARPPAGVRTEIVQVGSLSSITTGSGAIAYNGSKAGFRNAIKCMQLELAQRLRGTLDRPALPLRIQLLTPAAMDTPLLRQWGLPREVMMAPEDVAEQILYDITRPPGTRVGELVLLPAQELY
ncbi:MAG TPA: SDR family oxidoreductase [Jatrophihabitans sp.]|nr:SDR family oxidoreductase [Jatrophihabitans sp.]